jgi:phage regulator Rha-like protein
MNPNFPQISLDLNEPETETQKEPVMNELISINPNQAVRMTSHEMAELTGKRHDNVKRTIETLVEQGVIHKPQIEDCGRINGLGLKQSMEIYVFDLAHKRDSFVVVAQLSPEFTAALVDRWQQLEAKLVQPALPDFTKPHLWRVDECS